MRVGLELPGDADPTLRARLNYTFRLFCAVCGHQPASENTRADVTLQYRLSPSTSPSAVHEPVVWLSRGYQTRHPSQSAPPPVRYTGHGADTLLHVAPSGGDCPDWLGEIFEWVSCADEYSVTARDEAGRPLFAATYAGRHGLDTCIPYAGVAMRCLQREICRVLPRAPEEPVSPCHGSHLVVPTHDVDYFPAGRRHAANRLARNAAISWVSLRRAKLGLRQAAMAASVASGLLADPLDCIPALVEEERRRGIGASYNFLARHVHRRDAFYGVQHAEVSKTMRWLEARGMEVGIHHSYTCLDAPDGLPQEMALFQSQGFSPRGGRQHWLRYTLDRLIPAAERAGLAYDTSIGYSENLGFRAGACFAFPPYNFEEERAATFLEIPMAMMDQAFPMQCESPQKSFQAAAALLSASRRLGWGGISLLWHPPALGEGWLPADVGELYLRLADERTAWGDEWMTPRDFVAAVRQRYVETGLLPPTAPGHTQQMPFAAAAMARKIAASPESHITLRDSSPQL